MGCSKKLINVVFVMKSECRELHLLHLKGVLLISAKFEV
ncbi:hypothetical protein HME9304_01158 [Flagellimonas maritima]|uniref:Uncharacterized protein n=1 Tax=Flagellimonas maritima TaxID=1383885 RepID=A0A2Z4LS42_9FLAO|nr:hypothetical protein HME9304_01158 [Allomuricauda aurantiaca]